MPTAHIPVFRKLYEKDVSSSCTRKGNVRAPALSRDNNAEKTESRIAQQYPVEKADVIGFQSDKHYHEPQEEPPEIKIVVYAVPCTKYDRSAHKQERKNYHHPAYGVLTFESFGHFIGDDILHIFGRGGEETFILNKTDPALQHQEQPEHHHYCK